MTIIGIGTDMIEIIRIKKIFLKFGKKFASSILSVKEIIEYHQHYNQIVFLSKCFVVKEAASKALGTGMSNGIYFKQFEISHNNFGKPILNLFGKANILAKKLGINNISVTITDERYYVIAMVIFEKSL